MNTSKTKRMALIGASLLTAVLCAGCQAGFKVESKPASEAGASYSVQFYHDDKLKVSCWMTSFAMSCVPDAALKLGGA